MGQKVHPVAFRLMNGKTWSSTWFVGRKNFADTLHQDLEIKKIIKTRLPDAAIAEVTIERYSDKIVVKIHTARPGVVIGRDGSSIDELKAHLQVKMQTRDLEVKVEEIRKPEVVAALIGEGVARQLARRIPYRRAVKQSIERAMELGVAGCKIKISGRLNGVDIARSETYIKGTIPLHTIRSNIDFVSIPVNTTYGVIGVKVWVYKGEF